MPPECPQIESDTPDASAAALIWRRLARGKGSLPAATAAGSNRRRGATRSCRRLLAHRRLAPVQAVRGETTLSNLTATLRAWLRNPGQRKTIAHSLGVHPQTVRYRMARLRELFGAALDDPDGRFELELALRVEPYARLVVDREGRLRQSQDSLSNS
jgi:hypothetical protein